MSTAPTETQQDQEQNPSESELGRFLAPAQPYIEKYGSKIVLALAALLLLAAIYIWWSRSSTAAAAAGWGEMSTAGQPEDFADIADDNPNTVAASWARLAEADGYLARAVEKSFADRSASKGIFEKSRDAYEQVLSMRSSSNDVRERALFGVARLEESLTGEDTSVAVQAYEELLSKFPESIYKEDAEARIAKLKDPSVQKFYGWFASQDPSVVDGLNIPDLPTTPDKSMVDELMEGLPGSPGDDAFGADPDGTPPPAPSAPQMPLEGDAETQGAEAAGDEAEAGNQSAQPPADPPKTDEGGSEEK